MIFRPKLLAFVTLLVTMEAAGQSSSSQSNPAPNSSPKPNPREAFVGDDACRSCHQEKVESFHRTAHYLTSRLPDKDSILGNFSPDANVLKTSNPDLFFRMEAKNDGFFQTAVHGQPPYTTSRTERFGLVVGSGGKGQTFLFWKSDLLFQLPVSYWNEVGWINSPGYRDGVAYFDRPVIPRCLECHGTYFESLAPPSNRYSQTGLVVGITCEKCHGPGSKHIQRFSSKSANSPSDSGILNPTRFSRDRQIDLCAWCHAGHGEPLRPTFSYIPGEPLDKYLEMPQPDSDAPVDVHGSQVELLRKSRCFQLSAMTCLTCHDVHTMQKDPAVFSERCLHCHKVESHPKMGHEIASNCIDCHMPRQHTNLIVFNWNGRKVSPEVQNHWIKIYPEAKVSPENPKPIAVARKPLRN
jgi:Cytochrome c554 and c-prime